MMNLEMYEEAIKQGELDINVVQTLTALYPKAIEYYSAFDNEMFYDLLNRLQSLLQRDDIQAILSSVQNPTGSTSQQQQLAA